MNIKSYKNLNVNTSDNNKWFISYVLIYDDGTSSKARKEYGKQNYEISLNKEKDLNARMILANRLMKMMKADIHDGIDPQKRNEIVDERNLELLKQVQAKADERISFDKALQMTKEHKGWINPVEGKEASASAVPATLENFFKPFLIEIGKADDIREVKRIDVKNFLEKHFNAPRASDIKTWRSASCKAAKARVSILFNTLIENDLMDVNPTIGVKVKNDSEKLEPINPDDLDLDRYDAWNPIEVTTWLNALANPESVPAIVKTKESTLKCIYTASHVLHYGFVRKSELLRIRMWMIDFANLRLLLPPVITKSARKITSKNLISVDMPDALVNALRAWVAYKFPNGYEKDDYLFYMHKPSIPYKYVTFTTQHIGLMNKIEKHFNNIFEDRNFYALKHSGVIKLFKSLVSCRKSPLEIQTIIKNQCRHSDFSQTESYLRKLRLEFDELRERINFE